MEDILVFAGSARTNAFSKKLAKSVALSIRRRTPIRARAKLIDLPDFDAPLFNADLKFLQGVSESMQAIKAMVRSHNGLSIATPTSQYQRSRLTAPVAIMLAPQDQTIPCNIRQSHAW